MPNHDADKSEHKSPGRIYEGRIQRAAREAAEAEAARIATADVEFATLWAACGWPSRAP